MSRYEAMRIIKRAVVQFDGVFLLQLISWIGNRKNRERDGHEWLSRSRRNIYIYIAELECDIMMIANATIDLRLTRNGRGVEKLPDRYCEIKPKLR